MKPSQQHSLIELDRQIRNYFDFLKLEKNVSVNTLKSYEFDFQKYRTVLAKFGIDNGSTVQEEHITKFIETLHRRGLSPRSIGRTISAVRGFHRYLLGEC
jgi:integrase/recombinase XerD